MRKKPKLSLTHKVDIGFQPPQTDISMRLL